MSVSDDDFVLDDKFQVRKPGTYRTFNEWSDDGYMILKGSKSHLRDEKGVALFHETQVEVKQARYSEYEGANRIDDRDEGSDWDSEDALSGIGQFDGEGFW